MQAVHVKKYTAIEVGDPAKRFLVDGESTCIKIHTHYSTGYSDYDRPILYSEPMIKLIDRLGASNVGKYTKVIKIFMISNFGWIIILDLHENEAYIKINHNGEMSRDGPYDYNEIIKDISMNDMIKVFRQMHKKYNLDVLRFPSEIDYDV